MTTIQEKKVKKFVCMLLTLANLAFVSCSKSDGGNEIKIDKPTANAVVSLNGDEISEFSKDYITGAGYSHINKSLGDHYYPQPLVFKWQNADCSEYTLFISKKQDLSDAYEFKTNKTSIEIADLFVGTKYYYKVKGDGKESAICSFTTKRQPRTVKIDGISNTRDVGGYETESGFVKQGLVYRGAAPDSVTENGRKWFETAGIKTIIDLREEKSRKRNLSDLNINYIEIPEKGCACYIDGDMGIKSSEYLAGLIAAMKAFAVKENYPIYFHCQIGRDRTGTLAYMLNGLLGVDYYTLTMDYELSCFSASGCVDYDDKEKQTRNMSGAMDAMYSYFMKYSKYKGAAEASVKDGIEKFLLDSGISADEILNIRKIMTEEAVNAD